jgi:hypothetical protein
MTNELGLEFIKLFHNLTAHLQNEGPRLLHVDCHCSHINLPLINFAREHDIVIIGYPPHMTHVLQGLDVILFSPLKHAYAKHAAEHLSQTGHEVQKHEFLSVLHPAVQDAFSAENIRMAWKATGLRPVNRSAISDSDLAASKEFSLQHTLPLAPPSPIRAVVDAMRCYDHLQDLLSPPMSPTKVALDLSLESSESVPIQANHIPSAIFPRGPIDLPDLLCRLGALSLDTQLDEPTPMPNPPTTTPAELIGHFDDALGPKSLANNIVHNLRNTSFAPVLSHESVTSACQLPTLKHGPLPRKLADSLKYSEDLPSKEMWGVVKEQFIRLMTLSDNLLAQNVLHETYCHQLQQKLAIKEMKKTKTTIEKVKGMENGCIFTSDSVAALIAEDDAHREAQRVEKERRQQDNAMRKEAKEWLKGAEQRRRERQNLEASSHATSRGRGKGKPGRPRLPPLEPIPEKYIPYLAPQKQQKRQQPQAKTSDESDFETDSEYDGF